MTKNIPGLVIAGTSSNCGKTAAAIGLISALRQRGLAIQPAKAGPDFLDAGWLAKVSGRPCLNLDGWMAEAKEIQRLLARWPKLYDLLVVEGAMGLYDGAGDNSASTAQLAAVLNLPALLIINAKGSGQSIAAVASGFMAWSKSRMRKPLCFCGLICTHVGSERHRQLLKEALEPVCVDFNVPFLGCLPCQGAPQIPARHLGLKQACEIELDFAAAGRWFAENVDLGGLLAAVRKDGSIEAECGKELLAKDGPTVAIARDEAFAFCYADLPLLLAELGAKVVYFSPLRDEAPPPCAAVYLPGGYPELYGQTLAANKCMLAALYKLARSGRPIYGECGGYMYMLEALMDANGERWPMAGLLPGQTHLGKRFAALGYRAATSCWLGAEVVYGHEFHYAVAEGERCAPLWRTRNALGEELGPNGQRLGNVIGSWVHLYPCGSRPFWRQWLKLAEEADEQGEQNNGQTG